MDILGLAIAKYSISKPEKPMSVKKKFMQTMDKTVYRQLDKLARTRGITIQELIRVDLIPTFLYGPIRLSEMQQKALKELGRMKIGNGRDSRHRSRK